MNKCLLGGGYRLMIMSLGLWVMLVGCQAAPIILPQVDESVIFEEQFIVGQTGPWLLETDNLGQTAVVDNAMLIRVNEPYTVQYSTLSDPSFDDFILDVDVMQLSGSLESSYGVLFRVQDTRHFYRFSITSKGFYVVERHTELAGWERLTGGWESNPNINRGLRVLNKLRIAATGNLMLFSVNGKLLTQIDDPSFNEGQIALSAGTFAEGDLEVTFDNVVVRKP
ncbi:MAG TPA: family 16 glycoside hydrolase [Anaerolineae bacterium]|nr:family 16 glycoside hydrolase [Anaerolineae bacterium]